MAIFDDVELSWNGVPYRLSGDTQIMRALAAVEDHVTISELANGQQDGHIPLAKLASAYAAVLRQAGCRVSDAEVYMGMWKGGVDTARITEAISGLLGMMIPPNAIPEEEGDEGNDPAPKKGASKSSSQRTKPQSSGGE